MQMFHYHSSSFDSHVCTITKCFFTRKGILETFNAKKKSLALNILQKTFFTWGLRKQTERKTMFHKVQGLVSKALILFSFLFSLWFSLQLSNNFLPIVVDGKNWPQFYPVLWLLLNRVGEQVQCRPWWSVQVEATWKQKQNPLSIGKYGFPVSNFPL